MRFACACAFDCFRARADQEGLNEMDHLVHGLSISCFRKWDRYLLYFMGTGILRAEK